MEKKFMRRALELAEKGEGYTKPNPIVGAVIVRDGRIIGEGYHERYGGPHAEVNALKSLREDAAGADMYVTLEPCAHYGKTPPCADAIIRHGIARVFIAAVDPNPVTSGKGIKKLMEAGIDVRTGLLEKEAARQNEIFFKYITTKRPFVILKSAMTLDGKIATSTGDSRWVTGEASRELVHRLRHKVSGIMAGIGTVLADDPLLTARREGVETSDPVRIIIDSRARIPADRRVLEVTDKTRTILAVTEAADPEKIRELEAKGVSVIRIPDRKGRVDLKILMKELGGRGIDSILLEGGAELNFSALTEGIVDKIMVFIAPKIVGGAEAKTPVGGEGIKLMKHALQLQEVDIARIDGDILITAYPQKEG